jgi:hypothetical protein
MVPLRTRARGSSEGSVNRLIAAALVLVSGCAPDTPDWAKPDGAWRILAADSITSVWVDTATVTPLPSREHQVRLLYQFVVPSNQGTGAAPMHMLVSEEHTDCLRATARVMAVTVYDTLARELARITEQPASGPPSMIGAAGPPLCDWLQRRAASR